MNEYNTHPILAYNRLTRSDSLLHSVYYDLQECANLAKENAAISGHQNLRQKIHYHASTKLENSKLKEVMMEYLPHPFFSVKCCKSLFLHVTDN